MSSTELVVILIAVVAALTGLIGALRSKLWLKRASALTVALAAVFILVFPMSDLRQHGSEMLQAGKPMIFVDGMVERDQKTFPRRLAIFCCVLALAVIALGSDRKGGSR